MAGAALRRVGPALVALGLVLAWDHDGAGVTRWELVVDGVARDITALVVPVGPTAPPSYGAEPCEACATWRASVADLDRGHVVQVRACAGDVCSALSNTLPAQQPAEVRVW